MRHYPVFLDTRNIRIVVCGAGDTAVAKLRLLLKSEAQIEVFGANPHDQILTWASKGLLTHRPQSAGCDDMTGARLIYAAHDDDALDDIVILKARAKGVLVNKVDDLEASEFITPAIVDRDPVLVAIGTEGAAPVLARKIKSDLEKTLPASLGYLVRLAREFRNKAMTLPAGAVRRDFWHRFFTERGPRALELHGDDGVHQALEALFEEAKADQSQDGFVSIIGAGPGDPDLLTRKAERLLHEADVVLHDRLVTPAILELARREAVIIETGKSGFGKSWDQADINAEMIAQAQMGYKVVRLKGGDPVIFARLDEETEALNDAGVSFEIVPGITAASAAAASIGCSLTRRGRNSSLRILTAHDVVGFADHDWAALAAPDQSAAIYMGKRASRFVFGRLLMHGANRLTPVTLVENASQPNARVIDGPLWSIADQLEKAQPDGPVIILFGIGRNDAAALPLSNQSAQLEQENA